VRGVNLDDITFKPDEIPLKDLYLIPLSYGKRARAIFLLELRAKGRS
jgi:hypothetical protein